MDTKVKGAQVGDPRSTPSSTEGLQFYNLSHSWGFGMPQWPSAPLLNLRIKEMHDRLTEKTAEVLHVNKRLQQAYQQIDDELELARRLQLSFLPQSLPEVPRARFAVKYQLCGRVGGDFYDAFRLDEHHAGFYVADALRQKTLEAASE